jgi:hypothetical protein
LFHVFDNGSNLDAHIKAKFTIKVEANDMFEETKLKCIVGAMLRGTGIDWYIKSTKDEPIACIE